MNKITNHCEIIFIHLTEVTKIKKNHTDHLKAKKFTQSVTKGTISSKLYSPNREKQIFSCTNLVLI